MNATAAVDDDRPHLTVVPDPVAVLPGAVTAAAVAWAVIFAAVSLFDVWALATGRETLSGAFGRAGRRHRQIRSLEVGAIAGLAYHLLFEKENL